MVRRSAGRALSILLTAWLALLFTEPVALHVCDMHGVAEESSGGAAPAWGHSHGGHGEHPLPTPVPHGASCLCLSHGCGASAASLGAPVLADAAALAASGARLTVRTESPAPRTDRLLPFPIGPPHPLAI